MTDDHSCRTRRPLTWACLLFAVLLAVPARAQQARMEQVGRFGAWIVSRSVGEGQPSCFLILRSTEEVPRVYIELQGSGRLVVTLLVTKGPLAPVASDDRFGLVWANPALPTHAANYPVSGSRIDPGPPWRMFMHAVLRDPAEVNALVAEASGSRAVDIYLPQGPDFVAPTAGFAEAWAAVKACDPSHSAGMP